MSFRGILITQERDGARILSHRAELADLDESLLATRGVSVTVEHSGINYKDALALAGRPGIAKISPLIPGIDLVGTVALSTHPAWRPGDRVILNGAGIGESAHGGLAERARVSGDALVRLPEAFDSLQAATIGTAGFTAMLAVLALERGGVHPGAGPVLVTGAAGGVGSFAIALLSALGYRVTASTGRAEHQGQYLRELGAHEIVGRLGETGAPLQSEHWAGVVDSVGSTTLVNALAQTRYGGTVAACGLAQGPDLPGTVLPFILRGVTLAGINSVEAPYALREEAWARLARDLDAGLLDDIGRVIPLDAACGVAEDVLAGRVRGRLAVDVRA